MTRSHLGAALAGALLVGVGVLIGFAVFGGNPDPAPVESARERPRGPAPTSDRAGVRLGSRIAAEDMAGLRAEIAALAVRLDALERAAAEERAALEPIRNLYEAWKEREPELAGLDLTDPTVVSGLEAPSGSPHGAGMIKDLAAAAGLEGDRRKAFETEVDAMLEAVRTLEKENAKVSVDGDTTTIEIPAYPDGADELQRRWDDWLSANLTAEERESLVKKGATGQLFGSRLGTFDRRITIRESGGGIRVRESATGPDGEAFQTETQGPALARDVVLQEYEHLLD